MTRLAPCPIISFLLLSTLQAFGQSAPTRDPRATTALQTVLVATGGTWPADLVARGSVTLAAGPDSKQGTIILRYRGIDQSTEETATGADTQMFTYSRDLAAEKHGDDDKSVSMELSATGQSAVLPLPLLLSFLNGVHANLDYVGLQSVGTEAAHRLRLTKSFADRPKLAHLTEFTAREVWVGEKSGLPLKITFQRRAGRGAVAAIEVEVIYSDWRTAAGLLLPHRIEEKRNGTLWRTIHLEQVTANSGLTDAAFALPVVAREVKP